MQCEIETPRFAITLQPPWGQAILRGKTIENRGWSIVGDIKGYRGPILLTQSAWKAHQFNANTIWEDLRNENLVSVPYAEIAKEMRDVAGKAFGVAMLDAVLNPLEAHGMPWHESGKVALVLSHAAAIEPVPCSGYTGFWRVYRCTECARIASGFWQPMARHLCKECRHRSHGERGKVRLKGASAKEIEHWEKIREGLFL